jgi:hypothetical protein
MFVLTTVLCVSLGWKMHRVKQRRDAVAWVESHRGFVVYYYEREDPVANLLGQSNPPGPIWAHKLLGKDFFAAPAYVSLADEMLDDISPITKLQDVEEVVILSNRLRDFSPLTELPRLRSVILLTLPAEKEVARLQTLMPGCKIEWFDSREVER